MEGFVTYISEYDGCDGREMNKSGVGRDEGTWLRSLLSGLPYLFTWSQMWSTDVVRIDVLAFTIQKRGWARLGVSREHITGCQTRQPQTPLLSDRHETRRELKPAKQKALYFLHQFW